MSIEEWRDVVGSDGRYQVSSLGRVRGITVDILTPISVKRNYKRVNVSIDGRRRLAFVHGLVARAFIGPAPDGYHVNHIDSNPANNCLSNLEYVTPLENQRHSWRTNNRQPAHQGTKTHFAKLNDTDVIRIRLMRSEGATYKAIAVHFNTKPANVWHICQGKTWKHLLNAPPAH